MLGLLAVTTPEECTCGASRDGITTSEVRASLEILASSALAARRTGGADREGTVRRGLGSGVGRPSPS